jgi:hypothetical protein
MDIRAGVGSGERAIAPQDKRKSAFRKSMAWLMGQSGPPRLAPGIGDSPSIADEKREAMQKQQEYFFGVAGDGEEWDVNGNGAKFWRRFSMAQKHAMNKADPVTKSSERWLIKSASGRKRMKVFVSVFGLAIIGAIIGIVIWRNKSETPSASASSLPSVQSQVYGGVSSMSSIGQQAINTDAAVATTSSTSTRRKHNTRRRLAEWEDLPLTYVRDPRSMPHARMAKMIAPASAPTPAAHA